MRLFIVDFSMIMEFCYLLFLLKKISVCMFNLSECIYLFLSAHDNVLERFILLTNGTTICGISINAINIFHHSLHNPICGIISHTKEITKFALDMKNNTIFYTDGEDIFKDTAFGQNPEHIGSADEVSGKSEGCR